VSETVVQATILALLLVLPISALIARRLPLRQVLTYAIVWVAIIGGGLILTALFT
jgi:aspartyl protease family protein